MSARPERRRPRTGRYLGPPISVELIATIEKGDDFVLSIARIVSAGRDDLVTVRSIGPNDAVRGRIELRPDELEQLIRALEAAR